MSNDFSPFMFPGMGQNNNLLTGIEMMNQAWQAFAPMASQSQSLNLSPEELEKRIEELKTVETWLKLNLSMLSNTIQALELQKTGLSNMNQFMNLMQQQTATTSDQTKQQADTSKTSTNKTSQDTTKEQATSKEAPKENQTTQETPQSEQVNQQAQAWFGMLQNQFEQLTQSTVNQLENFNQLAQQATHSQQEAENKTTAAKRTATKKASTKKTSTKKSTAKKAVSKKTASKKENK